MAVVSGRVCEVKLESTPWRRVKSHELFALLEEIYRVDRSIIQDCMIGDVSRGTYYLTEAKPESQYAMPSTPEEWELAEWGSVSFDGIFTDLLKRGLVEEGMYIITVGW